MASINSETLTPEMLQPVVSAPESESQNEAVTPPVIETEAAADESADQQTESEHEEIEQPEEKPKRDSGFQRRIKELVEERNQERLERQKITQQLTEALKGRESPKQEMSLPKAAEEIVPPKIEDFDSYEKYQDARADWAADRRLRQFQAEQAQQQAQARQQEAIANQQRQVIEQHGKLQSMTSEGEKKYPDFYEKVFPGEGKTVPISEAVGHALLESDKGIDLMYYLSTNKAEAERIAKLSVTRQLVEIGKLENSLPTIQKSKAPAPINPIGGKKAAATAAPRDDDDMDTWVKKEKARMKDTS